MEMGKRNFVSLSLKGFYEVRRGKLGEIRGKSMDKNSKIR